MNGLERPARDGDSPVDETLKSSRRFPSTTGHEKPCGNLGGPSSKAKYYLATDSEPVPRGKGEKNPSEGSEIDLKPLAYIQWEPYGDLRVAKGDCVPFV